MSEDERTVSLDDFKRNFSLIGLLQPEPSRLVNMFENLPFLTSSSCHIFKHATLPIVKDRIRNADFGGPIYSVASQTRPFCCAQRRIVVTHNM